MKFLYLITCSVLTFLSYAQNLLVIKSGQKYMECFNKAGLHYNIPPNLLYIIAKVESNFNPYALNFNKNNSYDIGLMQINSSWIPKLTRVGISSRDLLDGCQNIQIGAWILSQNIKRYGLTAEAIGHYNSSNNYSQNKYISKIFALYNNLKIDSK